MASLQTISDIKILFHEMLIFALPDDVSAVMSGSDSGFIDFDSSDAMSFNTLEVSIAEIKQLNHFIKICLLTLGW